MQPTTPKDGQRERPLQKSMFLPEFQPQPLLPPRPQPLDNIHYNPLKRSSMPVLEGMHQSSLSPSYHGHNVSYSQSPYPPNLSLPLHLADMRAQSQHELLLPKSPPPPAPLPDNDLRAFSKFEKALGFEGKASGLEGEALVAAVVEQVREKHLPLLLKGLRKELSEELGSLRVQLLGLRGELKAQWERQEAFNSEVRSQTGNIINFNTNNINNINKGKKEESDLKELEKEFFLLERKYAQIEVKLSENLTNLYNEFEKITQRLERQAKGFKVSAVKSALSPILLEYRETFTVRGQRGDEELLIGTCCYYVDRNGYLLDSENKYLTDLRGHQIRLEEKHLKLLEQHKLLHR